MCTVTFLPLEHEGFILTSNRDERPDRKKALPPQLYQVFDSQVVFPKDAQANGTWIAATENGFTLCLLNGAFETHTHKPPYRLSRGLMLLDFFKFKNVQRFVKEYDFTGIEPFTLLIINETSKLSLTEIRWDEAEKLTVTEKDTNQPHIWSSATLYPLPIRQQRENWFAEWLLHKEKYEVEDILHFHHFGGTGNKNNDILMDRGVIETVSITAIRHYEQKKEITYEDLLSFEIFSFELEKSASQFPVDNSVTYSAL
jgi:hypothetical protein